ncbi:UxaA family hydrolase [Pseudoalteromonas sp. SSMSWG5]|jgi:hypothetical protein|uniref:UxaA family hydrolase n=1 Tax=Pseudoalteromonas TaxID=53246 RepID=UPI000EC1BD3F|nr:MULTISPECIES: UxaA family hydrolase [unclassified Pseudoalteromonas]HCV05750.1 altronate hydrolase [Pseudoalteromonas sp.]MCF2900028.1 UxaA family hydrolase [Pseudoalteromonas sp. OFAV1]MCF2922192.1 UxaA family hydrolase [Pseudoalteromonas sp. APAL1]MCO7249788.1 UxaA family hydrolase [Pseudoalteromonas sp. Ps84H-4]TGV20442.1 altronate hydrolase [Pseudoalteromonas sp. MEBiC 03607]|tara:strand:+ start:467 stop:766 length:300 start_codon:yes stop_codon:yes gene_type:complete
MSGNKFVLLHEQDNVIVCCQAAYLGEAITIANDELTLNTDVTVGHKVACRAIQKGEQILKYGVPIGSATDDIEKGQHVHLHNMKSDYIASHTRHSVSGD